MKLNEVLEMLNEAEKPLDVAAVVDLIKLQAKEIGAYDSLIESMKSDREQLMAIHKRLDIESDESGVLLEALDVACLRAADFVKVSEQSAALASELESYRSKMRDKIVGRSEIVSPVSNKGAYLAQLVAMDDDQLFSELDKLDVLLSEHMGVALVTEQSSEFDALSLVRFSDFKL